MIELWFKVIEGLLLGLFTELGLAIICMFLIAAFILMVYRLTFGRSMK